MDWMSWKTWTTIGLIIVALFAIYTFAATQSSHARDDAAITTRPPTGTSGRTIGVTAAGVPRVHDEWLEVPSGSYRSQRNLFAYKEPPPPPPPPAPPPTPASSLNHSASFRFISSIPSPVIADADAISTDGNRFRNASKFSLALGKSILFAITAHLRCESLES
jgi:hypothetical protein